VDESRRTLVTSALIELNSRDDSIPDAPRCLLWCLDWWGDAAGAYERAEHPEMPSHPDALFDDCTLVGPDNALQAGSPGYAGFTRVALKNCRLVSLNFSQPQGKPGTGVIFSTTEGRFLHVDLEDCTLMGCKIFGAGKGEINYATKGDVKAYVQFQQDVPKGMHRLGHWPVEVFQTLLTPPPPSSSSAGLRVDQPDLGEICEAAPVVWQNRLALMKCNRPASGGTKSDYFLTLEEVETGQQLARFAEGYSLASAFVHDGTFYAYASRFEAGGWNDATMFKSKDLKSWTQKVVITQEKEHLFNSSVCCGENGFVMAYESDDSKFTPFQRRHQCLGPRCDGIRGQDLAVLQRRRPTHLVKAEARGVSRTTGGILHRLLCRTTEAMRPVTVDRCCTDPSTDGCDL
jgi:hypothetical protein